MPETVLPLPAPDLEIEGVRREANALVVELRATSVAARCPSCGHAAVRVHSRYWRTFADLPCQGVPVRLRVHVRRFRCDRAGCTRAMFTERIPALGAPYARRTVRQSKAMTHVGVMLGGEAGARLLPKLGLAGSADTVLRLIRRSAIAPSPPPRVVGVDDWAIRRGHTYGTIVVDLERHEPIDLLDDRTAETLSRWLADHPGVEIVARDRAEAYAQGAGEGAPQAVQVADRWHLLKNASEALERVLQHNRIALQQAAKEVAVEAYVMKPAGATPPPESVAENDAFTTEAQQARPTAAPTPRQALYQRVQALHAQGLSNAAIGARTGLSRPTVRKYVHADACPERAPRRTKIGAGTDHDSFLRARWTAGCCDAVVLWKELRARGFRGTRRTVQRHVASWRRSDHQGGPVDHDDAHAAPPPTMAPPSPRQLRWWLLSTTAEQPPAQARYVERLIARCPAIAVGQRPAQSFARIIRARDAAALTPWLEQAETSTLSEFRDFAAGLRRDAAAVEAALTYAWSNGQTEGQVTKLKMLKRQMYGRASVPLLRQRLLLAA